MTISQRDVPCRYRILGSCRVVRGFMIENELNIYIADKSIKFGRDVQIWTYKNPALTPVDAIKMGGNISNIFKFSPNGSD